MTAHLLAHTDYFAAGIARSGAYNRSLTPMGFQAEERVYWEAIDTYIKLSPFTWAKQIAEKKAPLLLIHGQNDNNSGTFPMQSERMYAALSGLGGITRLVLLPHESHGYQARDSILHTLAEQHEWLNEWVVNKVSDNSKVSFRDKKEATSRVRTVVVIASVATMILNAFIL